jgi:hypothetical protein
LGKIKRITDEEGLKIAVPFGEYFFSLDLAPGSLLCDRVSPHLPEGKTNTTSFHTAMAPARTEQPIETRLFINGKVGCRSRVEETVDE